MNNSSRTIAKNAGFLMSSQILTWLMSTVWILIIPRHLGATDVGKLELAASLWVITSIMISFGMDTYLNREVARRPDQAGILFSNSMWLRTLFFVVSLIVMAIYVGLENFPLDTIQLIVIFGVITLIDQYVATCQVTLYGLEQMGPTALGGIAARAISVTLSVILVLMGFGVLAVALVNIPGSLFNLGIQFYALRRVEGLQLRRFNWLFAREILKKSLPFLVLAGSLTFYQRVDFIIISYFVSEEQLGWYGAAGRFLGTLLFIPTVYMTAVFPALSRMQVSVSDSSTKLTRLSFNLLNLVAVPIGLGLLVIANQLVVLVFGPDFAGTGPVLMVMGVVLIFMYQNTIIGMTLIASDRQKPWTRVIIIAAVLTIPLDLIFIPWCQQMFANGAIGGALAFVVTEAYMLTAGIRLLPKGTLNRANLGYALRTVLSGLIMLASIWWLRDRFLLIPITAGVVVYLICIFSLRLVTPEMRNIMSLTIAAVKQRLGNKDVHPAVGNSTK